MSIVNSQRDVDLSQAGSTIYINLPATPGISPNGYWFYYTPVNGNNNAKGAKITPYKWGSPLPLINGQSNLTMEGTMPLITESWDGANVKYHGSCVEWIGPGVNDITDVQEGDAFFFSHLGALAASDDVFYWDRVFLPLGGSEWQYYQYHAHSPTSYVTYENGRLVMGGDGWIDPGDKAYGYMISTNAKVSNTFYTSVMARIHTPSVGGAHNSHNDVTLPTVANKNYLQSGILRGIGERYHAFYITANSAQWEVFNRTYTDAAGSFGSQISLGTYDLADPAFNRASNIQSQYPIRASCGTSFGARIYFPVIMTNQTNTSNFDLEIWSFNSLDTIAGGSLIRTVLESNVTVRPDCVLCLQGTSRMFAAYTDTTTGGVRIKSTENGTTYTDEGQLLTNSTSDPIRVHGFEFNSQDFKFYTLLSGTASGGANTYLGPGLYSFELDEPFDGYQHMDYDAVNNAFIVREPLANGYVQLNTTEFELVRSPNQEPQAIGSGINILDYGPGSTSSFYNKRQVGFGGKDFYYHSITLRDGRRFAAGQVAENIDNLGSGTTADFLFSVYSSDLSSANHFAFGGPGDDYFTGVYQGTDNKVWLTGYTKSEIVPKGDIYIHGWARNLTDGGNEIEYNDIAVDSTGNIYVVGNHEVSGTIVVKYSKDYDIIWQYKLEDTSLPIGYGITIDSSDNVYICGSTTEAGAGSTDALVVKITPDAEIVYSKVYGTVNAEVATSITAITKSTTQYLVMSVVSGTSTTFVVLDTLGNIIEQFNYSNLIVNKVRPIQSEPTSGRYIFAGEDGGGTAVAKFGMNQILSSGTHMQWVRTYSGSQSYKAYDIVNTDQAVNGDNAGFVLCGIKGTTDSFMLKVSVNESAGPSYAVSKTWAKTLVTGSEHQHALCGLLGLCATPYTEEERYVYAVGCTDLSNIPEMGMEEGLITRWDASDGELDWQNVFGHDMEETLLAVANDITGLNIISVGWSESHSFSRDGILFRSENLGFGTGLYTMTGTSAMPYYYQKSLLTDSNNTDTLNTISVPSDSPTSYSTATYSGYTWESTPYSSGYFDGAYGINGVFQYIQAYVDLDLLAQYINSPEYKNQVEGKPCNPLIYISDWNLIGKIWQAATVGDSSADDGNMFGYDIIEASDGTIYAIGQTSGDVAKTNTGSSGVYDYLLIEFDPITETFEWYQNGTEKDEETYALCELANGKIAFTGRTSGDLGDENFGGYDIFLGIYDPITETFHYDSIGSGLDDEGVNIHDLGDDELIITYSSFGTLSEDPNTGSEDLGAIKYNYSTNTWGTSYQFGSATSEFYEQNGKPSALLENRRLAITVSSAGIFADDAVTYGFLDLCLAILDIDSGTWKAYQVGTTANEISSSCSKFGDQLLISGNQGGSFTEDVDAIFVEFDAADQFISKTSSL